MKVAVLGSGAGALAVAADMSRHGRHTVMADLDDERADDLDGERVNERAGLESVRAAGSITVTVTGYGDGEGDGGDDGDDGDGDQHGEGDGGESDQHGDEGDEGDGGDGDQHGDGGDGHQRGDQHDDGGESDQHGDGTSGRQASTYPVDVADSVAEALAGAELAVVVVPCDARERWVRAIAPHTTPDHTVLLMGEGGGAIEPPTVVAETNMLPHRAHATGPGTVDVTAKRGGVLVASLSATPPDTARVMEFIGDVWPQAAATDTVWTTVLTSYDAIEDAAADVTAAQAAADVTAAQAAAAIDAADA